MIDYIRGPVIYKDADSFVIECGGIGLRVLSTASSLAELTEDAQHTVFTELIVREDAMILVGFSTRSELGVFRMLITVSGVGPKVALGMLSSINYADICSAIVARDAKLLQTAQGIGKKTAERIVVELSDRAQMIAMSASNGSGIGALGEQDDSSDDEALGALVALGYKKAEAQRMLAGIDRAGLGTEEVLRAALQRAMG